MSLKPPTDNQSRFIWVGLTALAALGIVVVVVAFVWGLGRLLNLLGPLLWPLGAAGIIAYLLDPIVEGLEKRKVPRLRAITLVFIFGLAILGGTIASIIPKVVSETTELISQIPKYTKELQKSLDKWAARLPDKAHPAAASSNPTNEPPTVGTNVALTNLNQTTSSTNEPVGTNSLEKIAAALPLNKETVISISSALANAIPRAGSWLFGQASNVGSWFEMVMSLVLIPVYTFYFLLEKRSINHHWKDYLPIRHSQTKDELIFILDSINQYLIAFFRGQVLVALCNGIMYGLGFLVIGLNYALLLGVFAVVITIIPFIGAIIVCITALLISVVQYGDWFHPFLVLVVVTIVQAIESLLISPKIMGDRVGLHPVVIIIAVMAGTTLFGGLLGGLLAIPFAAALRVVMFRYVWKKRPADAKLAT